MKKLLRNIVLLLLPILVYYGVFLGFVGAVGLDKAIPGAAIIGQLGDYRRAPVSSVIIGNSRLAHFNMAQVQQVAGRPFANLAFGGASLKENLDELEWLMAHYPQMDEVVFGLSFYTLNANYRVDRFDAIETALYNPFALLTDLSYNLEMLQSLGHLITGQPLGGGESETEDPADYVWVDYTVPATGQTVVLRGRVAEYLNSIAGYVAGWAPETEQFERLLGLIDDFTAGGGRFVVVLPPMHDAVLEYAARPAGIEAQMLPMIARLRESAALVLDYEFTDRPDFADDQFFDGFHLDYNRGLPRWTEMLFEAIR